MDEIKEKYYKAKIELYKGIREADNMIIHTIKNEASAVLRSVIEPKKGLVNKESKIELTNKEFEELSLLLNKLSSDNGFETLNSWINQQYIIPKNENLKVLSILK